MDIKTQQNDAFDDVAGLVDFGGKILRRGRREVVLFDTLMLDTFATVPVFDISAASERFVGIMYCNSFIDAKILAEESKLDEPPLPVNGDSVDAAGIKHY